jgi:hypothetical protein
MDAEREGLAFRYAQRDSLEPKPDRKTETTAIVDFTRDESRWPTRLPSRKYFDHGSPGCSA